MSGWEQASREELLTLVAAQARTIDELMQRNAALAEQVAELERRLGQNSLISAMPTELVKTLIWDQGSEMAAHAAFTLATTVDVYFAHPHSPRSFQDRVPRARKGEVDVDRVLLDVRNCAEMEVGLESIGQCTIGLEQELIEFLGGCHPV